MYEQPWCSANQFIPSQIKNNLKNVKQQISHLRVAIDPKEEASR
jgi:hypothetical protein